MKCRALLPKFPHPLDRGKIHRAKHANRSTRFKVIVCYRSTNFAQMFQKLICFFPVYVQNSRVHFRFFVTFCFLACNDRRRFRAGPHGAQTTQQKTLNIRGRARFFNSHRAFFLPIVYWRRSGRLRAGCLNVHLRSASQPIQPRFLLPV